MDRTPSKSLAIPRHTPPAEYRAYVEHPEVATLNQVMLHYLDIEEILKLYRQSHEQFETRQALNTLAARFKLPSATTFKELLRDYDMQYATVRSYLYNNRGPEEILLQAALEGNIQALYNQLTLYPELRKGYVYAEVLARAAEGGHEVIMELLFELGAEDIDGLVLRNAAKGGQLTLILKELAKGFESEAIESEDIESAVFYAAKYRHKAVLAALLDYLTTKKILHSAIQGAVDSGDVSVIAYIISRGGNDYKALIQRAATFGRFDIVREYWDKLVEQDAEFNDKILHYAIEHTNLATVKFIVETQLVSRDRLEKSLVELKYNRERLLKAWKRKSSPSHLVSAEKQLAATDVIIAYLERVVSDESS